MTLDTITRGGFITVDDNQVEAAKHCFDIRSALEDSTQVPMRASKV